MKTTVQVQKTGNKKFKQVMIKVVATLMGFAFTSSAVISQNLETPMPGANILTAKLDVVTDQPTEKTAMWAYANTTFTVHSKIITPPFPNFIIEPAREENLEIENWMTDSNYFGNNTFFSEEKDQPLEVENWMTNELNFTPSTFEFIAETEQEMQIETWMLNGSCWEN